MNQTLFATQSKSAKALFLAVLAVGLLSLAWAAPADAKIKVGMVLPLTGPLAATGNDIANGSRAAIASDAAASAAIELIIVDDQFDPVKSEQLARQLVTDQKVDALLSCFGTVSCLAVSKVAQELSVPLIGAMAGAEVLRAADRNMVYSVRGSATQEITSLLKYMDSIGKPASSVVIQDDGFGKAYANSLVALETQLGYQPIAKINLDPKAPNYVGIAKQARAKGVEAIILFANTTHSVGIIKALNDSKYYGQILNLAGQANGGFVKGLSGGAQLAIFSTVTPSPFTANSVLTRGFHNAWKASQKNESYSYINFEAYINARVLIEAQKRGKATSAASLDRALGELNNFDMGGLVVGFSGKRRQGATFADTAVLLKSGRFKH